jgi:hypothetical protein
MNVKGGFGESKQWEQGVRRYGDEVNMIKAHCMNF